MDWTNTALADRVADLRSPKFGVIGQVRSLCQGQEGVVDLGYGEPDFVTPAHVREAARLAMERGYTHYVLPVEGFTPLREAIARKLQLENGIPAEPAQILVTSGVQEAINVALLTLVNPGDEVIVPEPYYYSDPLGVMLAEGTPVYTHLDEKNDFRLDIEDVESKITPKTKAIIYISPNCPTGSVFPAEDLRALAELAAERHIFVITDEVYEKLIYDGTTHTSIASFPEARPFTISMFGFSKAYAMTGWRIGYMVGPTELVRTMLEVHGQLVLCTSSIAQQAALAALEGPQDCIEQMRAEYQARRDLLVSGLNRLGFLCRPPLGAFYIYSNVAGFGMSSLELAKLLAKEARVISYPGSAFTAGREGDKYLRFSYTRDMAELETALERIEETVGGL